MGRFRRRGPHTRLAFAAGVTLSALALPASALGADAFVDAETGSGSVCTQVAPCATVANGITAAGTNDDVFVDDSAASYAENLTLSDGKSLRAQNFTGGSEGATIIDGGATNGISISAAAGTIQGFTLRSDQHAVSIVGAGSATITGNTFDEPENIGFADVNAGSVATIVISGNTFTNSTSGALDNGVGVNSGADPTISGNTFTGFDFAVNAAGDGANPTIENNTITGGEGDHSLASSISVNDDASATVTGNTVQLPDGGGRGIHVQETTATAEDTSATLERNRVLGFATGVEVEDTTGAVTLEGDLITGSLDGLLTQDLGTLGADQADVTVTNVTFAANDSDISITDADLTLDSSILEDDVSRLGSTETCTMTFSRGPTTTGDACETFQTAADPGFVGGGNFHLAAGSAMVDAGNPAPPVATVDLDGDPRELDGNLDGTARRDIGADECVPDCRAPSPPPSPGPPEPEVGDTNPPDTTITDGPKDKTKKKEATFQFASSEPGSSFQCAIDAQALKVPCTSPYTVKVKKGKHTFQVRATDAAGNVDASPAIDSWKVKKKKK
jgi:hypothetical protein